MLLSEPHALHSKEPMPSSPTEENRIQHLQLILLNEQNSASFSSFLSRKSLITSAVSQEHFSLKNRDSSIDLSQFQSLIGVSLDGCCISCFAIDEHPHFHDLYFINCIFDKGHTQQDLQKSFSHFLGHMFIEKKANRLEIEVLESTENGTATLSQILQNADFCFEGIKRGVFKKRKDADCQRNGVSTSSITETCSFSLLAEDYFKKMVTSSSFFSSSEYEQEIGSRLCRNTKDMGIDSLVIRAVIMKEREKISRDFSIEEPVSPHDLCILLVQRKDQNKKIVHEELIGVEVEETLKTIRDLLNEVVQRELGAKISAPIGYLNSFDFVRDDGKKIRELVFRVEIEDEIVYSKSLNQQMHWVPLQYLIKTPLHPEVMAILCKAPGSVDFLSESRTKCDEGLFLEIIKSDIAISELYDVLAHGLHVQAYAARGFGFQEMSGIALRDESGDLIGGLLAEAQYGGYFCHKIWIDPEFITHKIEKRIIKKTEELARQEGARFIIFSCMDWEMGRTLQQLGYQIEWQRSGYDRSAKLLYLRKEL